MIKLCSAGVAVQVFKHKQASQMKFRLVALAIILNSLIVFGAIAQKFGSNSDQSNFKACQQGWSWSCDSQRLSADQRRLVESAAAERNFAACKQGWLACDKRALSTNELQVVLAAENARNYEACKLGWSNCDYRKLSADQLRLVRLSEDNRNFEACKLGWSSCETRRLTSDQLSAVQSAYLTRNFEACRQGWSTCDGRLLTEDQTRAVVVAQSGRNYEACRHGWSTCQIDRLTSDQRRVVELADIDRNVRQQLTEGQRGVVQQNSQSNAASAQHRTPTAPLGSVTSSAVQALPAFGCAENNSCYGDLSLDTGRSKTVRVEGYYRSDGTYVRGHYRSAPKKK